MNSQRKIQLTPPLLSPEHIKEKIICVRAHRERIFNVSTQSYKDKIIFHNYGHGGAGWTFLFGCVHESIRQFEQYLEQNSRLKKKQITIIGAGCYGLLTAIMLARNNYNVQIIAKETENIPSNKAAGFFFPRPRKSSTAEEIAVFLEKGIESYKTYLEIIQGKHPFINGGPKLLPAYYGPDIDPGFSSYISHGLKKSPQQVIVDFGNGKSYQAIEYHTIFINSAQLMRELWRNRKELNIPIIKKEIHSFDEIESSLIFNCAGWGAKKLTQDARLVPVQGHLITLQNQSHIDQLQYMINFRVTMQMPQGSLRDELIYFAPKESGILGITFLRGQESENSNMHEFDRLLQRSHDFFGT